MQRHCDSSEEHQVPIITKENVIVLTKIPARVDGFLDKVEYSRCMHGELDERKLEALTSAEYH